MTTQYDVIVIGEGIAGLTAAGLLARPGCRVASFEAKVFGGLILNLSELDPVPQEVPTSGAEWASDLLEKNVARGVVRFEEAVASIVNAEPGWLVQGESTSITARHVIVASGARYKPLGIEREAEFEGRGLSHCADCDGPMLSGKAVVVVGGGDSALQEALIVSAYASTVHLAVRGDRLSANQRLQQAVAEASNVQVHFHCEVMGIEGDEGVTGIKVRGSSGGIASIACAGVFPFVGLLPNTEFLPAALERDSNGALVVDDRLETSMASVYAIGAVRSGGDGLLSGAVADASRVADAIAKA